MLSKSEQLGFQILSCIQGSYFILPLLMEPRLFLIIHLTTTFKTWKNSIHLRFNHILLLIIGTILSVLYLIQFNYITCALIGILYSFIQSEAIFQQQQLETNKEEQKQNIHIQCLIFGIILFYNIININYQTTYISITIMIFICLFRILMFNYINAIFLFEKFDEQDISWKLLSINVLFSIPTYYGFYIYLRLEYIYIILTLFIFLILTYIVKRIKIISSQKNILIISQIIALITYVFDLRIFAIFEMFYLFLHQQYQIDYFQYQNPYKVKIYNLLQWIGNLIVVYLLL